MTITHNFDKEVSLNLALAYGGRGWRVFPVHSFLDGVCTCDNPKCNDPAKHPLTPHGCKDGTTDPETIRRWHADTKGLCNWGLATGRESGVWVLDMDGETGLASLARLERQYGPLPLTPTLETGGGRHCLFAWPGDGLDIKSKVKFYPGLDTRGTGGYSILPPSLHKTGKRYAWLTPPETPLAQAPPSLLSLVLGEAQTNAQAQAPRVAGGLGSRPGDGRLVLTLQPPTPDLTDSPGVGKGQRNATLCRLAGVHLARGENVEQVEILALDWAGRCSPPLPENQTLKTVRALALKHGRQQPPPTSPMGGCGNGRKNEESPALAPAEAPGTFFGHSPGQEGDGVGGGVVDAPAWPVLEADAYHGLAGAIVRAIEPETEADPAGVLLTLLTCVGSGIGRSPYFSVGPEQHHANLFACLVGDTSSAKGQAWGIAKYLMERAAPHWAAQCIGYGLSSGEGLIERVRDAEEETESVDDGEGQITGLQVVVSEVGAPDKRLLCLETEFIKPITVMRREGNTLSANLRNAWDGQTLEVITRGKSKLRATGAHVSIIGHITPDELTHCLSKGVEVANGFANRFLWALVKRSRLLPDGGDASVLTPFVKPLADALARGAGQGEVWRSDVARQVWHEVYPALAESRPGAFGKATDRARPQVMRLALIYALLDASAVIEPVHLRAALAVWHYCEASARLVFGAGPQQPTTPRRLEMLLLDAIRQSPGINRSGLHDATGRKVKAEALEKALGWLQAQGLAHPATCSTGGRPGECWFPGPQPGAGEETNKVPAERDASEESEETNEAPAQGEEPTSEAPDPDLSSFVRHDPAHPPEATAVSSFVRLDLPGLFAQVKALGGRLVRRGGVVVVEAVGVTPEMEAACREYKADLLMLVPEAPAAAPPMPEPGRYGDAEAVIQAARDKGGQVVKDEDGHCTLRLPRPDPELEAAFTRHYADICGQVLSESEYRAEMEAIRRLGQGNG